ncbi:ABC-2 family transporter protein [Poriferisphaera corsica]|uniref:ABC-2 family transporter protein n=1 Tax=Poriferisphaera corsica TaxID=2528020 RepID=A0A517YQ91_9BACT|nr:ABC transporter permease subunit [Poriferisphaera corsica]QDU32395.1 ABC-2 family transporter protein [Poriferisphaera corsica]
MQVLTHWLWRMIPGNPMVVRIVSGGSVRMRDLWLRMGYLGALVLIVFFGLMAGEGMGSNVALSDLAASGSSIFQIIAYGQIVLVCLIAPLFMAAAISQEQSAKTYDILLTTPLTNMQIVLGNLIGRLFFILSLLASGLPLFAILLIFGGVRASSVFYAFSIAATTAIFVGSVAVFLSVMRLGGRKAVFTFVISIAAYLLAAYMLDSFIIQRLTPGNYTTYLTPFHPLLVLDTLVRPDNYQIHTPDMLASYGPIARYLLGQPLASFLFLTSLTSLTLITWSALVLRNVGRGDSKLVIYIKSKLRLNPDGAARKRKPRHVTGRNPIAWRESHTRGNALNAILSRYAFLVIGLALAILWLALYHFNSLPTLNTTMTGVNQLPVETFKQGLYILLLMEILIIALVALYMAAGCVSREREDGTLDLLLTTPMTQKQYVWGKLRGLVQFLILLISVPVLTVALVSVYSILGSIFGWQGAIYTHQSTFATTSATRINEAMLMLPESALLLALVLIPFVALCVATGMYWSLKSKGVLGAVIPSVSIIGLVSLVFGFCGFNLALNTPVIFGATFNAFSPTTAALMIINPWDYVSGFPAHPGFSRIFMTISAVIAAAGYFFIVAAMLNAMVKNFDQTVRKLSGTG